MKDADVTLEKVASTESGSTTPTDESGEVTVTFKATLSNAEGPVKGPGTVEFVPNLSDPVSNDLDKIRKIYLISDLPNGKTEEQEIYNRDQPTENVRPGYFNNTEDDILLRIEVTDTNVLPRMQEIVRENFMFKVCQKPCKHFNLPFSYQATTDSM